MAWLLLTVTAVLALLVLVLMALTLRLRARIGRLEATTSSDAKVRPGTPSDSTPTTLDETAPAPTQYVITRVGEPEPEPVAVATVPAPVFADLVLKETVVQTASLLHGVRRALAPETRNRIRFHVRAEVKRSRKQRRTELREVRREWAARQRAAAAGDTAA